MTSVDSSSNQSEVAQSSGIAAESSTSTSNVSQIISPPRSKTKSKSCGNSPKCGSREHSRPHSPAWKKPSKSGSPIAEMEREGGEEAQFGQESGAGSGYSSPYSERATPPYLRWAKSLEDVLDDFEGMELFKQFLADRREDHLLDFWYGCKGFRKLDTDRLRKVAEELFNGYVNARSKHFVPCLSQTTRTTIFNRLAAQPQEIDQTIYDDSLQELQMYLRERHAEFVRSESYINYLQDVQAGGWDSPKCYSHEVHSNNSSSSGEARRLSSSYLPTVLEDTEFESESERLANAVAAAAAAAAAGGAVPSDSPLANVAGASVASIPYPTPTVENPCSELWPSQSSASARPIVLQQDILPTTAPAVSNVAPPPIDDSVCGTLPAGGAKRRAASTVSSGGGGGGEKQQGRSGGSMLTRTTLVATFGQRLNFPAAKNATRLGAPLNPYHAPYTPYLPTSAQDSELQSMSSDATTESGFSGTSYRKDHRIMQQHIEHNRDPASHQNVIPRTNRPQRQSCQNQDMTHEAFRHKLIVKLEELRKEREGIGKVNECLRRLSEQDTDHRAAVNSFYNEEKIRRGPHDEPAEAILEDYCSRVPDFMDSPKQSPHRSPGVPSVGRRRSPIAKSPIRVMTTSYPSAAQSHMVPFHPNPKFHDPTAVMSQSVIAQPSRAKTGHHSAGNTMNRVPKHEPFVPGQVVGPAVVDKRAVAATMARNRPAPRYPPPASDTSGIYSGTSTEPSLVSARFTPNLPQRNDQSWTGDRPPFYNVENDGNRHRVRGCGSANTAPIATSGPESKSHRSSTHRGSDKATSSEKTRTQKTMADVPSGQTQKNVQGPRRSEPIPPAGHLGGAGVSAVPEIAIGIYLPKDTPYLVRFQGHQITLKQFKPLIPRKGNFRYFFECVSDELGTSTVIQREVVEDHEVLPFFENNKIIARITVNE